MSFRYLLAVALVCLCSVSCFADATDTEPAPSVGLKHFTRIDEHVFAGSKPDKDAAFEYLRSIGVKYILQAKFLPGFTGSEKRKAARYGIAFLSVPMNASPIAPQERHVNEALRIMRTRQPIYIHCVLGRDRTSLLAGLYRVYFEGMSPQQSQALMKEEGFRDVFFLHGLKAYFDSHKTRPASLADLVH